MSHSRQPDECGETESAFFTRPSRYLLTRHERDSAFAKHREQLKRYHDGIDERGTDRRTDSGHRRPS